GQYLDFEEESESYLGNWDNELDYASTRQEREQSLIPMKIRRVIVEECCRKPCSLEHIWENYCG
ncbi:hypothetical protein JTB14_021715, partial [Gonioctena quinquepunctata]